MGTKLPPLGVALAVAMLAGCSGAIPPKEAVMRAADAAPGAVAGVFAMRVQGTGAQGGNVYLNSEADYRDPRNLTVAMPALTARQLAARHGVADVAALEGRDIVVRGAAMRVRINFLDEDQPTGKYYYQTHVPVRDASQIEIR